jgi:hypothetical protein
LPFDGQVFFGARTVAQSGTASYYRVGNLVRVFYTGNVIMGWTPDSPVNTMTITVTPNSPIALRTLMGAKVFVNWSMAGYRLLSAASAHDGVSTSAVITAHVSVPLPASQALRCRWSTAARRLITVWATWCACFTLVVSV